MSSPKNVFELRFYPKSCTGGPKKSKKAPNGAELKIKDKAILPKQKVPVYMCRSQKVFGLEPHLKNNQAGPKRTCKPPNGVKLKQKDNALFQKLLRFNQNEVFEHNRNLKNSKNELHMIFKFSLKPQSNKLSPSLIELNSF